VVRINDRGPFVDNRVIDLSRSAADIIGLTSAGVAPVRLEIMHYQPVSTRRTVQIASFGDRSNAVALIRRLSEAGLNPAIETATDTGVHSVVIPDVEKDEVAEVQDRLATLGHRNVLIRETP
jgi:rare lipoprotein A